MTTQAPSTTNKTTGTTSVPGAGGCSPFDFSTCDPNCVIMDAQGCLSCQCKGSQNTINLASEENLSLTTLVYTCSCAYFQPQRLLQVVSQRLQL